MNAKSPFDWDSWVYYDTFIFENGEMLYVEQKIYSSDDGRMTENIGGQIKQCCQLWIGHL